MRFLSTLRQLRYPREFRIGPPTWPLDLLSSLEKLACDLALVSTNPDHSDPGTTQSSKELLYLLAEVGTGLWRLRRNMLRPGTDQPLEEMRRPFRHLQATWDALAEAGMEVREHTKDPYHSGMSITVAAFEPTQGIAREVVIETIKPTIYFGSARIQKGQVIVGTPAVSGENSKPT